MKSNYMNPEIQVLVIAEDDVIRTSPVQLGDGEYGMPDLFA